MKLEEQCTTVEQSHVLLEMGFSRDTASLEWSSVRVIDYDGTGQITTSEDWKIAVHDACNNKPIPCWTISDMMDIIHNGVTEIYWEECEAYYGAELITDSNRYVYLRNIATGNCDDIEFYTHNLLRDNLFDCLIWLKEQKYI